MVVPGSIPKMIRSTAMFEKMKNLSKVRKILNLLIQVLIFGATYLFIYQQVFLKTDMPGLVKSFEEDLSKPGFVPQLLFILLLMIFNWGIEAMKWKILIDKVEKVSYVRALQAVLTGVSISSFTPNRVGEYFGRVFILRHASHIEGILITILGSMGQLLITVLAGTIALVIFIPHYIPEAYYAHGYVYYGVVALVITLDLLLLGLFFNVSFLSTLKEKILRNGLKKFRRFFRVFAFYHNRELGIVLLLSLLRYIIFSTQFWLLLRLFEVPVPFFSAQVLISLIFFIMAAIPTIALTELGIRGSVSLYFFGMYLSYYFPVTGCFNLGIFSASILLWMINLGLPALIGTIFVFRLQFFRKTTQ